jgi:hypothetical protein
MAKLTMVRTVRRFQDIGQPGGEYRYQRRETWMGQARRRILVLDK